jgi:signal transduction histidine kinase
MRHVRLHLAYLASTRHNQADLEPGRHRSQSMNMRLSVSIQASSRMQRLLNSGWVFWFWVTCTGVAIASAIVSSPRQYRETVNLTDPGFHDPDAMRRSLAGLGLTPSFIAWVQFAELILAFVVSITVGYFLLQHRPRTWFVYLLSLSFAVSGASVYPPSIDHLIPDRPGWAFIIRIFTIFSIGFFFMFAFFFPDGHYVPRWTIVPILYNVIGMVLVGFFNHDLPTTKWWNVVNAAASLLFVCSIVYSTIYRYRHVSNSDQQRQTKWVVFGIMIALPGFFLGDSLMRNIGPGLVGVLCLIGFLIIIPIATNAVPITVGIAILRNRLFDIDVILNRTFVWLTLTGMVILTYVVLVIGVGNLIGAGQSWFLSIVVTGIVAVAFQPVRLRVQQFANRLLYGDRDDPYSVITRLGQKIEDSLSRDELLPAIVRTTTEALRLPYAALLLHRENTLVLAASSGVEASVTMKLPLNYQGESIGVLMVAPRQPNESFGPADRQLLEGLARQIGVAVHTLQLAEDLQRSRERLVTAREEERLRLRRDLHDGLGAQLAGLTIQASAVRALIKRDPDQAELEIQLLRDELRNAIGDIRRLVHGLRPPSLDELGLAGALRERLARFETGGVDSDQSRLTVSLNIEDDLRGLPAAVDVAIFRIVEEAVTNVVKHAEASRVAVSLRPHPESVELSIVDDGIGLPETIVSGVGMQSMRERVSELGGRFSIHADPEKGTEVLVSFPIPSNIGEIW